MSTSQLFTPITLRGVTLRNRVVISPMCQYAVTSDGMAEDYHLAHLGRFAMGGAGLVFVEATAVSRRGRITSGDVGLWKDQQVKPLARIARFLKQHGAAAGIQLGHAGRKASVQPPWLGTGSISAMNQEQLDTLWPVIGPSAIPVRPDWLKPKAMTLGDIERVKQDFAAAARRALAADFDVLELHSAHGYLLHQFLSPLANHRTDEYGGSPERRMRLAIEVASSLRSIWPEDRPLFVRLSAVDNVDGGCTIEDTVELAGKLASIGVDVIDCSSGGMMGPATDRKVNGFGYQVPYAEEVRRLTGVHTMAVGLIVSPEHAENIVATGHADLVAIGRAALDDPNWPFHAGVALTGDATESSLRETLSEQQAWWLSRHAAAIRQLPPWQQGTDPA